ncbi:hypothetical protein VNI00_019291 [Paramarasmius palmivorus]|uniref:DNA 3'-5' helicase n=1 Tax=Paramarasmius palmivorus TaxID=297713 RepID=A0AAW0ARN0_9AGAR
MTGKSKSLARTPSHLVGRLLVLVLSQAYWAAGHICLYVGMKPESARKYFYEVFVVSGQSMTADGFSKVLGTFNSTYLGFEIKLRDFRQLMSCMLITFTRSSFYESDDEDVDVQWAHESFGHSVEVGRAHYGLDVCSSATLMAPDAIANMQRVCLRWHVFIHQLHPSLKNNIKRDHTGHPTPESNEAFNKILIEHFKHLKLTLAEVLHGEFKNMSTTLMQGLRHEFQVLGTTLRKDFLRLNDLKDYRQYTRPAVPVSVRKALTNVLGRQGGKFTSPQQAELINSVGSVHHVFGVLETGGGKSLAFFGATVLYPKSLFIVVSPLVALTNDLSRRLLEHGIRGGVWGEQAIDIHSAQIVLVSAHVAGKEEFRQWVTLPGVRERLRRLFIDECHKIATDDTFRECFNLFHYLTGVGFPLTLLSGTLMPRSMPYILEKLRIEDVSLVDEIRRYTGRPNLKFHVRKVDEDEALEEIKRLFELARGQMSESERGLIYTRTIKEAEWLSEELGIGLYVSVLDSDPVKNARMKKETEKRWRDGVRWEDRWIVGTQAFGQGVDYRSVRFVFHLDPQEILNFFQEVSRGGRDGIVCYCHCLYTFLPVPFIAADRIDHQGRMEMIDFLTRDDCVRLSFGALDREVHSCVALDGELCYNCERDAEIPYDGVLRDNPTFDRPQIRVEDARADGELRLVPISVESNAQVISCEHEVSEGLLRKFSVALDRCVEYGCLVCWVKGVAHVASDDHRDLVHWAYPTCRAQLEQRTNMTSTSLRPFCYRCWVPFRSPCNHPPSIPGQPIDPDRCPHQVKDVDGRRNTPIVPALITLIFLEEDEVGKKVFSDGIAVSLGVIPWTHISELSDWLMIKVQKEDDIPNPCRYVLAFYELYRELLPV